MRCSRKIVLALVVGFLNALGSAHSVAEEGSWMPSPKPPAPMRQPLLGERLSFHGRWLGLPVGHGWIEVKEVVEIDGRRAYHVEAQGHSNSLLSTFYPIHDIVHSYLDVETLQPLRFEKNQREGHYRADEVVTFDHTTSIATYRSLLNQSVKEIPLPPFAHDLISAFYWLRAAPLHPDRAVTMDLYSDEKIYATTILVSTPRMLGLLQHGTFRCVAMEPKASFKGFLVRRARIWAYVTLDERRLPLMVQATTPWGSMSAILDEECVRADARPIRLDASAAAMIRAGG